MVGHFIQKKQSYLGQCKTCYSNSKTVVISSQDSQWIILFKYDGGVLSYMFFLQPCYSTITQNSYLML